LYTSTKPTKKQIDFLSSRSILAPPTKRSCSNFISYVIEGNGAGRAKTQSERISHCIATQRKWNGEKVKRLSSFVEPELEGVVKYVLPKNRGKVRTFKELKQERGKDDTVNPFDAVVDWGVSGSSIVSCGLLKLLTDEE